MTEKEQMNLPAQKLPMEAEIPAIEDGKPEDFRQTFQWRVLRILSEFIDGFQFLADFNNVKTVTVFGSARLDQDSKWHQMAHDLGKILAENDYGVVTGGGPGIMEAANQGAADGNGESIGLNIKLALPYEQRINKYVRKGIPFYYFFSRKVMLSYSAQAFVYFPGGFGTLDEFFEIVTLIQTKKISSKIPVVCVGREFWQPFVSWIDEQVYQKFGAIDKDDMKIYTIVDTAQEAFDIIKRAPHIRYF